MVRKQFFLDLNLDKELAEYGFVQIQILDNHEIKKLEKYFHLKTTQADKINLATFFSANVNYRKDVHYKINSIIEPRLASIVTNKFKSFFGNYMVKPYKCSPLILHSDWSYVNEKRSQSFNVWIPLVEANSKNGGLWVVPKSHTIVKFLRGVNLPRNYYQHIKLLQTKYAKPLKVKPGHAIVYDNRLLHFSYSNYTKKIRLAVSLFMLPTNESFYYYYMNSDNTLINKYELNSTDKLLQQKLNEIPTNLTLLNQIDPESFQPITIPEIEKKLKKVSFFGQLRNSILFNKSLRETKN